MLLKQGVKLSELWDHGHCSYVLVPFPLWPHPRPISPPLLYYHIHFVEIPHDKNYIFPNYIYLDHNYT